MNVGWLLLRPGVRFGCRAPGFSFPTLQEKARAKRGTHELQLGFALSCYADRHFFPPRKRMAAIQKHTSIVSGTKRIERTVALWKPRGEWRKIRHPFKFTPPGGRRRRKSFLDTPPQIFTDAL
jgi:hypothetical protein